MAIQKTTEISNNILRLISFSWDQSVFSLTLSVSVWFLLSVIFLAVIYIVLRYSTVFFSRTSFEIDQAEIGIGNQKLRFKPNRTDRQVAYAIWVELSTRKIGLPIDFKHDLISEIYASWYVFFAVTRDLVKTIPAYNMERDSTQKIINLAIAVLNEGLRPHLTKWRARFDHWYAHELRRYKESDGKESLHPQSIQSKFPCYKELKEDMERVNQNLIKYREKMEELVLKD